MKTAEIYNRLHEIIGKQEIPANIRADLEMLTLDILQDMRRAPRYHRQKRRRLHSSDAERYREEQQP